MRGLIFLSLLIATPVHAARAILTVGANLGLPGEEPLQFAEDDAQRVHDIMRELGGVDSDHAFLLMRPSAAALRAAIKALKGDELFFYFSGHGTERALHMGGEEFPLADLRTELQKAGAKLTVVVLDSCRTSALIKGARLIQVPFVVSMPRTASGYIELRAAAEGQPAQESTSLRAAVFSHYWAS